MERFINIFTVLVLALVCAFCKAQDAQSRPASPAPIVRQTTAHPLPFSLDEARLDSTALIDFPSGEKISQQDRDLRMRSLGAISERANAAGLDFAQGTWDEQEIVCSALPNHLFLLFTRGSGTGNASSFTASIPRGGGQVRVIPILRRGYSFFSPAPVNALTISIFNHIRAEEHPAQPAEWLATGLCYAALAGTHPQVGLAGDVYQRKDSNVAPGSLTIAGGGIEISFIDLNIHSRRNLWRMSFDGSGRLLKATLTKSAQSKLKVAQRNPTEVQGKPVRQSTEPQGKTVQ
ncbi:MAG: hypothetical protein WAN35_02840 [Terracidiphilus sp.]